MLCHATLTYSARERSEPGGVAVDVEILDGRHADLPRWDECGFELIGHHSIVEDWANDDEVAAVHYAEVEAIARDLTGCEFAMVSDHVKRTANVAKRPREQAPVHLVHSDFAAGYDDIARASYRNVRGRGAAALARCGLTGDDVADAGRIVMVNVWRNIGPPRMDLPLAVCDARTVTPAETRPFHYTGYVAGGRSFDALDVLAPDLPIQHRWYSYPEMTSDEVLAFRTYDTDLVRKGRTWFTPHSAFREPGAPDDAPPCSSIELRVMCLFAESKPTRPTPSGSEQQQRGMR